MPSCIELTTVDLTVPYPTIVEYFLFLKVLFLRRTKSNLKYIQLRIMITLEADNHYSCTANCLAQHELTRCQVYRLMCPSCMVSQCHHTKSSKVAASTHLSSFIHTHGDHDSYRLSAIAIGASCGLEHSSSNAEYSKQPRRTEIKVLLTNKYSTSNTV